MVARDSGSATARQSGGCGSGSGSIGWAGSGPCSEPSSTKWQTTTKTLPTPGLGP